MLFRSDRSGRWTPELRKRLDVAGDSDDGLFWIEFEDLMENFEALFVNKVEPTFTFNSIPIEIQYSPLSSYRRLVKIGVKTRGVYTFSIDVKDIHYTLEVGEIMALKRLTISQVTESGFKFIDAAYNQHRNTHCRTHIEAGEYLALIEIFYTNKTVELFDRETSAKYKTWRNVVFSSYGASTCDLHMFTTEECQSMPMQPGAYV